MSKMELHRNVDEFLCLKRAVFLVAINGINRNLHKKTLIIDY